MRHTTYDIRRTTYGKKGFTLVEVLFVVALVAVIFATITPYLRAFHVSWQSADRRAEVLQNARVGMDKVLSDLRQASEFTSITGRAVTFNDVDGASVAYAVSNDNLTRNGEILAGAITGVNDLGFDYYDITGKKTSKAEEVRAVEVTMVISDPEGNVNPIELSSRVYVRSTPVAGEGYTFSKNSDFSTEDTIFSTSDIFYVKVWTSEVNYANLDYATCQLRKGGTRINFSLTNNDDETYTGSQDLTGFAAGNWTVNMDVKDNESPANRYRPSGSITIQ
ncbi:MAG: prepilin-type N-terminal cleavage/methylation domain-containing protein [Candidatus Omnitrophota bacterium]